MKLLKQDIELHTNGVQGQIDYRVASNAKMMKLLSDSLYSDKISAVIRELSTNAWDSHVKAGNQNPFTIQLPNDADPTFRIRDYGTGMTPEAVESMYNTYGASDKTETNDQQGCMGLGSKSPFAYTTSFVTVSYYNGTKVTWLNAPNEKGLYNIQRMAVEKTSEPNGLEISFSVDKYDINEFQDKASEIYRPFPVKPNVIGGTKAFKPKEYRYLLQSEDGSWQLREADYGERNSFVIMGFIEYPIDLSEFKDHNESDRRHYGYRNTYQQLLNMGFNLHMNIGDVEMDISREGLQYTKATVQTIKNKLDQVLAEIKEQFTKKLAGCENLWEARCLYGEMFRGNLRNIGNLLSLSKIEYEGVELTETDIYFSTAHKGITLIKFYKNRSSGKISRHMRHNQLSPGAMNDDTFYVNDIERGQYAAVMRDMSNNSLKKAYLFNFEDDTAREHFRNYIGMPDSMMRKVSSIPKAIPKKRTKNEHEGYVFENKERYYIGKGKDWWSPCSVDMDKGGVYLNIYNWQPSNSLLGTDLSCQKLGRYIKLIDGAEISVPAIYGIRNAQLSKFQNHPKWIEYSTYFTNKIKIKLNASSVIEYLEALKEWDSFTESAIVDILCEDTSALDTNSSMKKFLQNYIRVRDEVKLLQDKVRMLNEVSKIFGVNTSNFSSQKNSVTIDVQYQKILLDYPMLKFVDEIRYHHYIKQQKSLITDYVKSIDKERKNK